MEASMLKRWGRATSRAALALLLLVAGSAAWAEDAEPEPDAAAILDRMARVLAGAQKFTLTAHTGWDVVQPDGEKLEFGETRRVAAHRPNRLRVDAERRDGSRRGFVYDGREIAVVDLDRRVYASVPKEGTLDEALDYFTQDLGMRFPLAELVAADLPQMLAEEAREPAWVGAERIDGVPCDHVAARGDLVDLQVWVAREGDPLPRRVVITYRQELGQPQFRADLTGWDLAPDLPESLFGFTPPEGGERVPIQAPPTRAGEETAR
jgi:hypothetical protein